MASSSTSQWPALPCHQQQEELGLSESENQWSSLDDLPVQRHQQPDPPEQVLKEAWDSHPQSTAFSAVILESQKGEKIENQLTEWHEIINQDGPALPKQGSRAHNDISPG